MPQNWLGTNDVLRGINAAPHMYYDTPWSSIEYPRYGPSGEELPPPDTPYYLHNPDGSVQGYLHMPPGKTLNDLPYVNPAIQRFVDPNDWAAYKSGGTASLTRGAGADRTTPLSAGGGGGGGAIRQPDVSGYVNSSIAASATPTPAAAPLPAPVTAPAPIQAAPATPAAPSGPTVPLAQLMNPRRQGYNVYGRR
jgi:hypothetical protein